jgi:transcriptional regulator with XRE-family HTH domain
MTTQLRALRESHGLTLAELAQRAGMTYARYWNLERGREPTAWRRLQRLADVLGVTTDAVLGRGETTARGVLPANATVLSDLDVVSRKERALLDAIKHHAEQLLGPQVLRLGGGWLRIAEIMWLGDLTRIRHHGLPRPALPSGKVALPKAPAGWYTGWESKRQRQLARGTP